MNTIDIILEATAKLSSQAIVAQVKESYIGVKVTKAGKETTKRFKKIDDAVKFVNANRGKQNVIVSEPLMIRESWLDKYDWQVKADARRAKTGGKFTESTDWRDYKKGTEMCPECEGLGYLEVGSGKDRDSVNCGTCDGSGAITVATRTTPRTPSKKINY